MQKTSWFEPQRHAHSCLSARMGKGGGRGSPSAREAGFVEGQNVAIEYRWSGDHFNQLPALAADLVRHRVAVIIAGPRADRVAKAATATIPVVFVTGSDPVSNGLVASMNRPGANLTGISVLAADLAAKRFGLLHDLLPQAASFGLLLDSTGPSSLEAQSQEVQKAAHSIGASVRVVSVSKESEYGAAFATLATERADGLLIGAGLLFNSNRDRFARQKPPHALQKKDWKPIPSRPDTQRGYPEAQFLQRVRVSATEASACATISSRDPGIPSRPSGLHWKIRTDLPPPNCSA